MFMNNAVIFLVLGFLMCFFLLGIAMLIVPKFFVSQTIFWNQWFLTLIGYDIEIKPKKQAELVIRLSGAFCLFISLIIFSWVFDIFMMLFR